MSDIHSNPLTIRTKETAEKAILAAKKLSDAVEEVAKSFSDSTKDTYQTLSSKVSEGVELTKGRVQQSADATKEAAQRAAESAKVIFKSAALKTEDTVAASKEYARNNPIPVAIGAVVLGVAITYLVLSVIREPKSR